MNGRLTHKGSQSKIRTCCVRVQVLILGILSIYRLEATSSFSIIRTSWVCTANPQGGIDARDYAAVSREIRLIFSFMLRAVSQRSMAR